MPDGFFLGALFGGLLLMLGLAAGVLLGRSVFTRRFRSSEARLHPMLAGLVQFTRSFSDDVSEYRALIEMAARRAKALAPQAELNPEGEAATTVELLSQIVQANEHLRRRLDEAESTLESQSAELSSYMTEARTDALTGLPNRRALDDELARRLAVFRRHGMSFGILLLDVDRFKSVNDRHGHHVGDEVLKGVARTLHSITREGDFMARYGGEEFAMLLGGCSAEEFMQAAERVRRAVERTTIEHDGLNLQITLSCGGAEIQSAEEASSLVRRADEALYASKSAGRNQSHWHDGRRLIAITADGVGCPTANAPSANSSESFRQVCADLRRKLQEVQK
jgi:diguanylate cyclase